MKRVFRIGTVVCLVSLGLILNSVPYASKSFAGELNILGGKISWSDKMYFSDRCSRYDFKYSNESGIRLLQLGFELNDPYGRNLISFSEVGIDPNKSGTWNMQICSKQFTNGLGPYIMKGIVKEYGSSQRQETREIYFLPLPGTAVVKPGSKCSKVKSTVMSLGKKLTCMKSGNKLVWGDAAKSPASQPSSTPKTQPTSSSTAGSSSSSDLKVGDIGPGGGVIYYYNAKGFKCGPTLSEVCRYLEAAPRFYGTSSETFDYQVFWGCSYTYRYGQNISEPINTGTQIGEGLRNTILIASQKSNYFYEERSPALIAQGYKGPKNLADWFIPSKDELQQLYLQRSKVEAVWSNGSYWSSSDAGGGYFAWGHDFKNNDQFGDQKINRYCIHLVRAF